MYISSLLVILIALMACDTDAFSFNPFAAFGKGSSANLADAPQNFYDIVETDGKGQPVNFNKFKGKVVYGVNVASKCGYTASGYALLERISAMKDQGVEVMIFPCNQFGGQEPGTDAEVANFCAIKGVKGANVFTKGDVNGPKTRPTYAYLKSKGVLNNVAWNFAGKFVIDKEGNPMPVKNEKNLEADIARLAAA
jgi:glutathione peroxidase-family protein